jgi:hypothetical protein
MAWKTETLIGTINGSNKDFTISNVPVSATLIVVFTGVVFEGVGSQPDQMQFAYTQSGTAIQLGLAPQVGQQAPWARYWY